jgi:hypothetical protein
VCRGQGTTHYGDVAVLGKATIVLVMVAMLLATIVIVMVVNGAVSRGREIFMVTATML